MSDRGCLECSISRRLLSSSSLLSSCHTYYSVLSSRKGLASRRAYAELAAAARNIELRSSIVVGLDGKWERVRSPSCMHWDVFGGDDVGTSDFQRRSSQASNAHFPDVDFEKKYSGVLQQHRLDKMGPPAKRRKIDVIRRQKPVEELTFSIDARQEYLTGFSKRKAARREQAREQAIKEAKEEKIRERKEVIEASQYLCMETEDTDMGIATGSKKSRPRNTRRRSQQSPQRTKGTGHRKRSR